MSNIAIKVDGLSKQYRIGKKKERYQTLRDSLSDAVVSPFRRARRLLHGQATGAAELDEKIWALKHVSFDVTHGEVVGIIGCNGAGKSTLLKILSRITEPTHGSVEIHGRVGALLEVGSGFHQELTGRENVYLNGAILGMKKSEIDRKFDEIVAFSEIEKFIDTPVKHYSSGMHVRLAFAVAAHLEPDILIVDEVLAVGDAAFQKKCLGKMGNVAKEGRTVLLVSHNMLSIQALCNRAMFIEEGMMSFSGLTAQVVSKYLGSIEQLRAQPLDMREDRTGGDRFRFTGVQFLNPETMNPWNVLSSGQPVIIRINYQSISPDVLEDIKISFTIFTATGTHLFGCNSRAVGVSLHVHPGEGFTDCYFPRLPLKAGRYAYDLNAEKNSTELDWIKDAGAFDVEMSDYYGTGYLPSIEHPGVLVDYAWREGGREQNSASFSVSSPSITP